MAEFSRPFGLPTGGYDELTTRELFKGIMKTDGIRRSAATWATGDLFVYASTPAAMTVQVAIGGAFVQGAWYDNTAAKAMTIEAAHATYERTDSIVLRLTVSSPNSAVNLAVLKGDYAGVGTSTAKALTQTTSTYELRIATILVSPTVDHIDGTGTTLITDTRLTSECGIAAPQLGFFSLDANGDLVSEAKQIHMGTGRITGVGDPVDDQDVDTKAARVAAVSLLALPVPTGNAYKIPVVNSGGTGYELIHRFITASASDTLQKSNDSSVVTSATTYYCAKVIRMPPNHNPGGTYRVKFTLQTNNGGNQATGQIRSASMAIGTEREIHTTSDPTEFSEDVTIPGSDIEIWIKATNGSYTTTLSNFRVYCTETPAVPSW